MLIIRLIRITKTCFYRIFLSNGQTIQCLIMKRQKSANNSSVEIFFFQFSNIFQKSLFYLCLARMLGQPVYAPHYSFFFCMVGQSPEASFLIKVVESLLRTYSATCEIYCKKKIKWNKRHNKTRIKSRTLLEIIYVIINLNFQCASTTDPQQTEGSKTHDVLL